MRKETIESRIAVARSEGYHNGVHDERAKLTTERIELQKQALREVTALLAECSKMMSRAGYMLDKVKGLYKQ